MLVGVVKGDWPVIQCHRHSGCKNAGFLAAVDGKGACGLVRLS